MQDAARASRGGLPSSADLFVGRDRELDTVSRMLAHRQTRLVTLTGPPGIGKTRLAVASASAYAERGGCAPVFVDLAPIRDPALVMAELAQAVGIEPQTAPAPPGSLASQALRPFSQRIAVPGRAGHTCRHHGNPRSRRCRQAIAALGPEHPATTGRPAEHQR